MKIGKWLLIAAIGIPSAIVAGIYIRNKAVGPTGWAMDDTMKELRSRLKDPDSMIVRSSYVITRKNSNGDTEIFICGIVDGKNSFGGYGGGTRFASKSVSYSVGAFETYTVSMEDADNKAVSDRLGRLSSFEQTYWNNYCVDGTHPPIEPPIGEIKSE
jgi:hypothetical protein